MGLVRALELRESARVQRIVCSVRLESSVSPAKVLLQSGQFMLNQSVFLVALSGEYDSVIPLETCLPGFYSREWDRIIVFLLAPQFLALVSEIISLSIIERPSRSDYYCDSVTAVYYSGRPRRARVTSCPSKIIKEFSHSSHRQY